MDQLRKAGDWLRRHHFWVLTVIAILVALGCWWRGANALWKEYQANKGKIESEFNNASTVRQKQFHANEQVQTAQTEQITKQQESVNALWKVLYDRQTAAVLKWPANLSEEFRNRISKLNFGEEIPRNLRAHYNNYIRDHFPELPKIVGALEMPDEGAGGMGGSGQNFDVQSFLQNRMNQGGRGGPEDAGQAFEEPEFLVVWADQQLIRNELAPRSTPSAKRIWKTQEDLWVYEALLSIIANTNQAAGADRFSNAAIRVIESLEVGRTAAQAGRGKGRIEMTAVAPAGDVMMEGGGEMMMDGGRGGVTPEMGMDGGGMMMEGYGMGGRGEMGMGMGMDSASMDAELFNNRYVSEDGAPIPDSGGDLSAFGAEFKRLPVRMRLWMDQRWLPQLISECANAPLQVEIQEVRINPADGGAGGYGGGGYGGGRGEMGGYTSTVATGVDMAPEQEPNMKTVVLQGTVYIFNPPSTGATQSASDPSLADAGVQ